MSKTKNPLLAFTEGWERSRAEELVDAILNNKIFVIVNKNNLQAQFLKKDDSTSASSPWCWFGGDAKLVKGSILIEDYKQPFFVLWDSVDSTAGFQEKHEPDAVVKTDEDKIYLWRIEG